MKLLIAAIALASASVGAFAAEFTNFDIPSGSGLTRAEVRAQAASRTLGRSVIFNDATTFLDPAAAGARAASVLMRASM
jgi:hypothetical protein